MSGSSRESSAPVLAGDPAQAAEVQRVGEGGRAGGEGRQPAERRDGRPERQAAGDHGERENDEAAYA